ncbi:hypothetical protein [Pedobacter agri]|uniref:hypothetical protein n=1 Tax=Pedobacter agri TaxID=454586 RepID=UPI00292CAB58|nr:hypothetical protein [Pedobacter agri]
MEMQLRYNEINARLNGELKLVCMELLLVRSQLIDFKRKILASRNLVNLDEILRFENGVDRLLMAFNLENIESNPVGAKFQTMSQRLVGISMMLSSVKLELAALAEYGEVAKVRDMEKQIQQLLNLMRNGLTSTN